MKVEKTVSEEAHRKDQWEVCSIDKVQCAEYRNERLVIFKH